MMSFCTKNIVNLWAIVCLVYEMRPVKGHMNSYTRLCESLSKKATRLQSRLCQKSENNLEVIDERKNLNTMQQMIDSSVQASTPKRSPSKRLKRWYSSYACVRPNISKNGFSVDREGLNLTVQCTKKENLWPVTISWEIPKRKPGQADCFGYVVQWYTDTSGLSCDYIRDKKTTSYLIDSWEDWKRYANDDETLHILVYPLPQSSSRFEFVHREFEPPGCTDHAKTPNTTTPLIGTSVTPSSPSITTTPLATNTTTKNSITTTPLNHTNSRTQTGGTKTFSRGPVVNKMVFSIVIVSLSVVILAILFLVWKKGKCGRRVEGTGEETGETEQKSEGAPHYISHIANKNGEALHVARWLRNKNVNVIMDKLSHSITNRRVWSEHQLLKAERIILIITPKYLKICNFHPSISNMGKVWSYDDELLYNEIALIRNKLIDKGKARNKFIGILVNTKKKDLPHWMSGFNCYKYKNENVDEGILDVLKIRTSFDTCL